MEPSHKSCGPYSLAWRRLASTFNYATGVFFFTKKQRLRLKVICDEFLKLEIWPYLRSSTKAVPFCDVAHFHDKILNSEMKWEVLSEIRIWLYSHTNDVDDELVPSANNHTASDPTAYIPKKFNQGPINNRLNTMINDHKKLVDRIFLFYKFFPRLRDRSRGNDRRDRQWCTEYQQMKCKRHRLRVAQWIKLSSSRNVDTEAIRSLPAIFIIKLRDYLIIDFQKEAAWLDISRDV